MSPSASVRVEPAAGAVSRGGRSVGCCGMEPSLPMDPKASAKRMNSAWNKAKYAHLQLLSTLTSQGAVTSNTKADLHV